MCDAKHIVSQLQIDIISQRENPKSLSCEQFAIRLAAEFVAVSAI